MHTECMNYANYDGHNNYYEKTIKCLEVLHFCKCLRKKTCLAGMSIQMTTVLIIIIYNYNNVEYAFVRHCITMYANTNMN